jgi:hypothetical protein
MTLKQALDNLQIAQNNANTVVDGNSRLRPGKEMKRRQGVAALPAAKEEVYTAIKAVGVPVFVNGKYAKEFVALAHDGALVLTVDYKAVAEPVLAAVRGTIGNHSKEYNLNAFLAFLREVKTLAQSMDIKDIEQAKYTGTMPVKCPEDADVITNAYLVKYYGAEVVAPALERGAIADQVGFKALQESGDDPKALPVFITNLPEESLASVGPKVFNGNFLAVDMNEPPTQEMVLDVFKTIKTHVRNSKKK